MRKQQAGHKISQRIVLLGCGNLAWHLAAVLSEKKHNQLIVCNHRPNPALNEFRHNYNCTTFAGFENIPVDADVYIICVADANIKQTAKKIKSTNPNALILHTSGSTALSALNGRVQGTGVLYPVQSFSRLDVVPWAETPILIEGSDEHSTRKISAFAKAFSGNVCKMNSESRMQLHLCAVLVNNFTNALYVGAEDHLKKLADAPDFKLLLPLIRTGVRKIEKINPREAQTGPAKRGDKKVMQKHLELFEKENLLKKVYKDMSKLIKEQQHGRD